MSQSPLQLTASEVAFSKNSAVPIAASSSKCGGLEMRIALIFMVIIGGAFSQIARAQKWDKTDRLVVELRVSPDHVRLADEVVVSVFFRSPKKAVTIWDALGWNASTGLSLHVLDRSGHLVKEFSQMYDLAPPDVTGKNELLSIGWDVFAGFDSHIPAKLLFPGPGRYILKCIYSPPLPRNYFQGSTIWGKEDGTVESAGVPILVK